MICFKTSRALYEGKTYEDIGIGSSTNLNYVKNNSSSQYVKNFEEITQLLIFAADVRDTHEDPCPEALHLLGMMHEYGLVGWGPFKFSGREEDGDDDDSPLKVMMMHSKNPYATAVALYNRAIELGYPESMYHLGLMYAYGRGVQMSYARAADLFRRAALEHYHAASMRYLAIFAFKGYGDPQEEIDFDIAQYWFRQCIEWSDPSSMGLDGNSNSSSNWIHQTCLMELKETTELFQKIQQFQRELRKNLTSEVGVLL